MPQMQSEQAGGEWLSRLGLQRKIVGYRTVQQLKNQCMTVPIQYQERNWDTGRRSGR